MVILTQSFGTVDAAAHAEHPIHARLERGKSAGDDAQTLGPGGDVVVQTVVADGDAIDAGVDLQLPGRLLDLVGDREEVGGGDLAAPKLLEGELELAVLAHAAEAERGGGVDDHVVDIAVGTG